MNEIWKDIKGYEGQYQVSNLGRVKSLDRYVPCNRGVTLLKSQIMKPMERKGYLRVSLSKDNKDTAFSIHRLVADAFVDNPDNKPQVNHIDGNKQNNIASNLEWCTNGENQLHAYKTGLHKVLGKGGRKKRSVIQIDPKTGEQINIYSSINEAERNCMGYAPNIRKCCLGERHTTCGYIWKFNEE